ncbi:unnamed protein product [Polarella glacialis]|uniref:Alpha-ketoglutarate-dependent dioxygenase AlkB-like domain-containing protein n=1 Tax=Polarella glacialis TaxID=89957 RepID=A0A813LPS4_POLGL|nr:unnamed protein product [Polarella glacialis]CAE8734376.1 unnamed protein product [Polarella glacialis]
MKTRVSALVEGGGWWEKQQAFREAMEELLQHVFSRIFPQLDHSGRPECANLNWYEDGSQGVGWHADDELLFQGSVSDCPIVSLSSGGTREFWLAPKAEGANPDVRQGVVELDLQNADLMTMEGLTQNTSFTLCRWLVPVTRRMPR